MPTFISDPPPVVYLLLFAALIATAAVAAQRQTRKTFAPFLAVASLLALVYVLDRFIDSPREGSVKSAQAMALAADQNKPDDFVRHVADTFVYKGEEPARTVTREQVKSSAFWSMLRQLNAHVAVWNFSRDDVKVIDDSAIEIGFMAKGERSGELNGVQLYARATFKRQPDGTMKMTEFRTFDALNHDKPLTIPNFP
ncbi:MAG TPA: hypothetical protein VGE74_27805 [Gemmata sp.]